jgi:hypothetical protein
MTLEGADRVQLAQRAGPVPWANERLRGEALGGLTLTLVIVVTSTPATDWGIAWFGLAAVLLGGVLAVPSCDGRKERNDEATHSLR